MFWWDVNVCPLVNHARTLTTRPPPSHLIWQSVSQVINLWYILDVRWFSQQSHRGVVNRKTTDKDELGAWLKTFNSAYQQPNLSRLYRKSHNLLANYLLTLVKNYFIYTQWLVVQNIHDVSPDGELVGWWGYGQTTSNPQSTYSDAKNGTSTLPDNEELTSCFVPQVIASYGSTESGWHPGPQCTVHNCLIYPLYFYKTNSKWKSATHRYYNCLVFV